ncbi:MAG TPA: MlaD family protein [Candidatus Omnitrophota bacterium]|jgi:phospholipid/cholesterol/gamma-HCH transport system substrate-binding protein|nr:MlaD family protein [Candidatus Omnitrophota bacterium]
MIFGKSKMELKVGIFVFVGLVILMIFVLSIGDIKTVLTAYRVKFVFNFINGVKIGSPVRFAGVDVGDIRKINFVIPAPGEKPKVELVGWITKDIKIPRDSQVWVNTLGLLGEKYIEIMPGRDFSSFIREDEQMFGNDPFAMQEFGELAKSVTTKLDQTLSSVEDLTSSLKGLSENVNDGITRIKNGEGTVGKIMYTDRLYNELEALIIDIKKHPWKLFKVTKD